MGKFAVLYDDLYARARNFEFNLDYISVFLCGSEQVFNHLNLSREKSIIHFEQGERGGGLGRNFVQQFECKQAG